MAQRTTTDQLLRSAPVVIAPRVQSERELTSIQSRIWMSQRLWPDAPLANMAYRHRISCAIDPDRFVVAVDLVVRHSDALRTVVSDRRGTSARAQILVDPPASTTVLDLPPGALDDWCRKRIGVPIDATRSTYDSVLLRHEDSDWTWWFDIHHVVTDAWSSWLVFDAVSNAYAQLALRSATDVGAELADRLFPFYVAPAARVNGRTIEREQRSGQENAAATPDDDAITPYGPRGPRTTRASQSTVPVPIAMDEALTGPYRALSRDLALLGVLVTSTAVTLHRLDGRHRLTIGVPIHRRSGTRAARVIGPVMEIFPLCTTVETDDTFATLYRRVSAELIDLIRSAGGDARADDRSPLDAIVNVMTTRHGEFAGFPTETRWVRATHVDPAHPIRVHASDSGDGLRLELDLNDGLSRDGAHCAMDQHLGGVLDVAVTDPDRPIGDVDLTTVHDRIVLDALNPPRERPAPARPVHVAIAARLTARGDDVVAEHDGVELTAAELDRRAGLLAGWLNAHGVRVGDRVGIRMPRCLDVLIAVHGALRAGAAFVMLDPREQTTRDDVIVADADLELTLEELPPLEGPLAVDVPAVELDDTAYVLYTSGSTGTPKGVPISHRGLAEYLAEAEAAFATRTPMVMALHTSLSFDLTITALFLPHLAGGRIVIIDGEPVRALAAIAADQRINVVKATPTQLEVLVKMIDEPLPLEIAIVGGEALRRSVAASFTEACRPGVRIFNEYGPTEAVVGCMLHEWRPEADLGPDVPIGRATPGAEVYVLDAAGRRAPVGTWGELYVRRSGMAEGYLNLPQESADRFVTIEGIDGGPLYRTGDRVRVERGLLVYGGRLDDQLQLGGHRIEPAEIENALLEHPDVVTAVVRVWSPGTAPVQHCGRCGLGTDAPGVTVDESGICSVCRAYDRVEPQARSWFRTLADLDEAQARARRRSRCDFDCVHLLSGGKDSTYALYQLVERGWRVHALTLDNGYLSDGARANIARTVADLDLSHEFVTTEAMPAIFRDSLDRFSNVCNGCYKTIYTLGVARAHELGIPTIVTGLSRGQFFETRLIPHQFEHERFDADEIDRTVLQARRAYHRTRDAVTRLLPEQEVIERDDLAVLSEIEFVDFFRHVDVPLAEMYRFLETRAPWVRPDDTGRSTNCLVNAVGIHVHRMERGYHNYAEPYSWDVRLGHKTRAEALEELDDDIDRAEVERMLAEIGYRPRRPEVLTAWYRSADGTELEPRLLASHLRDRLPARMVPTAFVHVDDLPLAASAKLDVSALPPPALTRAGPLGDEPPTTETEVGVAEIWSRILGVEQVGAGDDFFDLGGASLAALETVAALEQLWDVDLPDALVFDHRTVRELASVVDARLAVAVDGPVGLGEPDPTCGPAPLTPGEEAMLFEYRSAPYDTRYNVTRLTTIHGLVDVERLRAACEHVVARHPSLHTAFDEQRTPLAVGDALSFRTIVAGEMDRVVEEQCRLPFDLETGPLVRVHVGLRSSDEWHILVGLHHICVDDASLDQFWAEVDAVYHGRRLPSLSAPAAVDAGLRRTRAESSRAFWAERLAHADPPADVTLPPPDGVEPDGYLEISGPVTARELASTAETTPYATALAAAVVVLGAHSRSGTAELGMVVSNRESSGAQTPIGYHLNTVPVSLCLDASATLLDAERAAAALVASVLPHRGHPLADIVRAARETGVHVPDTSIMLAYQRSSAATFGRHRIEHRVVPGSAIGALTFFVYERGDELSLGLEHRGDVVGTETARRLLDAFANTLEALCRQPHRTVDELRLSLAGRDLAGPALDDPAPTVLHRILDQSRATPHEPAIVDASGEITTYEAVVDAASGLAGRIRDLVGSPRRIGVCLPRSSALVESVLGTMLSGATYVPIDPATPPRRLEAIIGLADLDAVVVDETTAGRFPETPRLRVPDAGVSDAGAAPTTVIELPAPTDPAYVIFTSGSTGEPAGVVVTHQNLASSTAARDEFYGRVPSARFLLTPGIGFDSSMVGLFWPLATGGAIIVPDDADVRDLDRLGALIANRRVTHTLMVPSLHRALLTRRPARLASLRAAIVAGEACAPDIVAEHVRQLPSTELVNEYGPSETTVWATAHRCAAGDDPVPIGRPIAGSLLRVADDRGRPMPTGACGELWIAGPGVTPGYLSGRSNDAFVDDQERRWYRTGDLVRVDTQARLLFLGRIDDQLDIGGVRVEPIEIESALVEVPGISNAVVVAAIVDGRESLVAHVVGDEASVDVDAVRAHLGHRLDAGALPRRIVVHSSLPETPNGKVDRRRIASLPHGGAKRGTVEPDRILDIFRSALARPDMGATDDFFRMGGDSLAAVEIVSAVGELVGRDVPVSTLLTAPSVASLAEAIGFVGAPDAGEPEVRLITLQDGSPDGPALLLTVAWLQIYGHRHLVDALPPEVTVRALVVADHGVTEGSPLHHVKPVSNAGLPLVREWLRQAGKNRITLLGWSLGGFVAFELGQKLARAGYDVGAVALVDTMWNERKRAESRRTRYGALVRDMELGRAANQLGRAIGRRIRIRARRWGRRLGVSFGGADAPPTVERFETGIPRSAEHYDPQPGPAPVVLYAAHSTDPRWSESIWRSVAPELRVVRVEGRHTGEGSVMAPEHVHQIADDLVTILG